MLGEAIAQGRQAEVYAWDGDERAVLKLYRRGLGGHAAEAAALAPLDDAHLAPRLLDTVRIDGRDGLMLQRLDGVDMLSLLGREPWRLVSLARELAHAALRIHRLPAPPALPDLIEVLDERIAAADLETRLRDHVSRVLDGLPAGDRLCHGDFHPGNAVVTADGVRVIDWPGATRGTPAADLARTMLLLRHADPLPGTSLMGRVLLWTGRSIFARSFFRAYRRGAPDPPSRLDEWTTVHAAARLAEGITAERVRLLGFVEASCRKARSG